MYQFKIIKELNGGYKFELGEIKMFVDNYNLINDKHQLNNPAKAIAYFNVDDSIYGISNEAYKYDTAEAFFDAIARQYEIFSAGNNNSNQNMNTNRQHFA